jgi:hypothetical protein
VGIAETTHGTANLIDKQIYVANRGHYSTARLLAKSGILPILVVPPHPAFLSTGHNERI